MKDKFTKMNEDSIGLCAWLGSRCGIVPLLDDIVMVNYKLHCKEEY